MTVGSMVSGSTAQASGWQRPPARRPGVAGQHDGAVTAAQYAPSTIVGLRCGRPTSLVTSKLTRLSHEELWITREGGG